MCVGMLCYDCMSVVSPSQAQESWGQERGERSWQLCGPCRHSCQQLGPHCAEAAPSCTKINIIDTERAVDNSLQPSDKKFQ